MHVPDAVFVAVTVLVVELDGAILGDGIADLVWVMDAVCVSDGDAETVLDTVGVVDLVALDVKGTKSGLA